ncbi:OPT oligopeptide transporter protein-domain-containing protein [Suillus subluteus]|nr:OPT oligopeptide transporter protein-domain-containing protein [Suillus subluteus]
MWLQTSLPEVLQKLALNNWHLIRASPRAQFYGQLIGSSLSIIVSATAYTLYQRAYTIPGPSFPAPTAYVWLSLARLLRDGQLPQNSASYMVLFAIIFGVIAGWIPSGIAFAIGFLNTPSFSLARLICGIIEYMYHKRVAKSGGADIRLIVIASGFVLGEGGFSVISLVLKTYGVGVASCWGCSGGIYAGCPT